MKHQAVLHRLDQLEMQESLRFAAFLVGLSKSDMRMWQMEAFEALAAEGIITPAPDDLWDRPQAEKDVFLYMLDRARRQPGADSVVRQAWHNWEQEHTT